MSIPKKQQMFLTQVTIIDCAVMNVQGTPIGMSFNPRFLISGVPDEQEAVVVDFSQVKKIIKSAIDDPRDGFDHKMLVPSVVGDFIPTQEGRQGLKTKNVLIQEELSENSIFRSYRVSREFSVADTNGLYLDDLECAITEHVTSALHAAGFTTTEVVCYLDTESTSMHTDGYRAMFTYTHGLRNSSSFGCQNIVHGHLSYVQILNSSGKSCDPGLANDIACALNNRYLVDEENVLVENEHCVMLGYQSQSRGYMTLTAGSDFLYLKMPHEVTIENIVDFVYDEFHDRLVAAQERYGAQMLYISEGLTKGACKEICS